MRWPEVYCELLWASLFLHCRAKDGGGININAADGSVYQSMLLLRGTLVEDNNAMRGGGGGLWVKGNIEVIVSNTVFVNNRCVCTVGTVFWYYVHHHSALQQQTSRSAFVWQHVTGMFLAFVQACSRFII